MILTATCTSYLLELLDGGVHLRPSPADPQRWESDFLTVAFEVLPAAR